MSSTSWLENVFREARRDFLAQVPRQHHLEFSKFGTIDAVYTEINDIQREQSKTRTLVALTRIEPYINGLQEYFGVVDTFVQVNPEILCLVWGPLKLILQLANSAATVFRRLVAVLEEVGQMLPHFNKYAESGLLDKNQHARNAMVLFYRDILDLHLEMFNFFRKKSLHVFLESIWPNFRKKLTIIQQNIESHKMLIMNNVTLEHVLQAYAFRRDMLEKFDEEIKYRNQANLRFLRDTMSSPWCEAQLQSTIKLSSSDSGGWLFNHLSFQTWLGSQKLEDRCLWIQGIPGAGKTFLIANAVNRLQNDQHVVLYAFLSQDRQSFGRLVPLLRSLLFQMLQQNHDLLNDIYNAHASNSPSSKNGVQLRDLFCDLAKTTGPLIIAVDGLDEIELDERRELLKNLLDVIGACDKTRLLLSSREERDILRALEGKCACLKVNGNNDQEIKKYVQIQGNDWISELRNLGADDANCAAVREGLNGVIARANGMFLYAKLVLDLARNQVDLKSIRAELANLPDGLDQAYGRILSRLQNKQVAHKILLWIACSKAPLNESEIKQAILIQPSMVDFVGQNTAWVDIHAVCGPVIEIRDGVARFVHFTAREYLFSLQSKNFLQTYHGHLQAVAVLLTYFSFKSFDPMFATTFEEEDKRTLRRQLLAGDLVLFRYAADFWLDHIKDLGHLCLADMEKMKPINEAVALFYRNRGRVSKAEDSALATQFLDDFPHFQAVPSVQQSLAESARFLDRLRYGYIVPEGDQWVLDDPSTLSLATTRFQGTLETALEDCEGPEHVELLKLYGASLFRCRYKFCDFHRNGFTSARRRNEHEKTHRTKFRCKVATCTFATVGFRSERELLTHMAQMHGIHHDLPPLDQKTFESLRYLEMKEITEMLESSVMNNNIYLVSTLWTVVDERQQAVDLGLLLQLAAWKGSESMIEFIVAKARNSQASKTSDEGLTTNLQDSLFVAVFLGNVNGARTLLKVGATISGEGGVFHVELRKRFLSPRGIFVSTATKKKASAISAAFRTMNREMLELLVGEFGGQVDEQCLFHSISATGKNPEKFADRFPQIYEFIPSKAYSYGILDSILYRHPVALEICLENGGDPNSTPSHKYNNCALIDAVEGCSSSYWKDNRMKNFGFIETLLRAGADPNPRTKTGTRIQDLEGMDEVEDHFGMKWDQLVQRIQEGKS